MATVKTVLVKGRSTRNGRFPLVVQVLHKRKKKLFIQGFSVAESLFDPTIGRIINDGKSDPELIRRINSKCEGISRTLLKSVSMTEKKLCVYEIEDVFKTYDLLTHGTGFYSYISDKIRSFAKVGMRNGTRIQFQPKFDEKFLGSRDFPFNKLSPQVITMYHKQLLASGVCENTICFYLHNIKALYRKGCQEMGLEQPSRFVRYTLKQRKPSNGVWKRM